MFVFILCLLIFLFVFQGKVWLIDFNPFGEVTDSLLFTWEELISGRNLKGDFSEGDALEQVRWFKRHEGSLLIPSIIASYLGAWIVRDRYPRAVQTVTQSY